MPWNQAAPSPRHPRKRRQWYAPAADPWPQTPVRSATRQRHQRHYRPHRYRSGRLPRRDQAPNGRNAPPRSRSLADSFPRSCPTRCEGRGVDRHWSPGSRPPSRDAPANGLLASDAPGGKPRRGGNRHPPTERSPRLAAVPRYNHRRYGPPVCPPHAPLSCHSPRNRYVPPLSPG